MWVVTIREVIANKLLEAKSDVHTEEGCEEVCSSVKHGSKNSPRVNVTVSTVRAVVLLLFTVAVCGKLASTAGMSH